MSTPAERAPELARENDWHPIACPGHQGDGCRFCGGNGRMWIRGDVKRHEDWSGNKVSLAAGTTLLSDAELVATYDNDK